MKRPLLIYERTIRCGGGTGGVVGGWTNLSHPHYRVWDPSVVDPDP